tara:strand:+ start:517 stop:675 length:159 start_codon:yes stop_codon:yes gene_type:complete
MNLYSRQKVLDILDKTLVVQKFKEEEKEKEVGDETYTKPKTRSEEKKKITID